MKTKLILIRFGETLGTLRLNEKTFLKTFLGFSINWDDEPTNAFHADSPGINTSDKILKLNTNDKIHLKCDVIDGSILCGVRNPVLYSFVLNKAPGYKVFFTKPEPTH